MALAILKGCAKQMYAYRMGGDEFMVLGNEEDEEKISEAIANIKKNLASTRYSASIGYGYRGNDLNAFLSDLIKNAEKKMYEDTSEFYKTSGIERRKVINSNAE